MLVKIENIVTTSLIQENHTEIEREKIRFGIRLIVNDLWKILIIYLIAIILNCFVATLITHLIFIVLRQVSFGFHFQNSLICLAASIIFLPASLYILTSVNLNTDYYLFLFSILSTFLLLLIAPVGTIKRPVFNQNHRNYLRKQLFIRLLILWIGVCQYSCRIKLLYFSIKIKIYSIQIPSSNEAIALRLMAC